MKEAPKLPVFLTLSKDEINNTYNEWMKIAADNVRALAPPVSKNRPVPPRA